MDKSAVVLLFVVFLAQIVVISAQHDGPDALPHNISLVVMAPFPDELTQGWDRGPALIPAVRVAAREINKNTEILPHFNLQLIVADTGCGATSKVGISFLRDIYENKEHQVVGIIGPACSAGALAVANLTSKKQVSLIHVTPSATSPQLEDPIRNTTYATVSSALSYVESYIELMDYNNWNRIVTLQDIERPYFKQTHSKFVEKLNSSKLAYSGSIFIGENSDIPLADIKSTQTRVVMVFAGSDAARKLLCYAYHQNMTYPNYQYIFHDRRVEQLVTNVDKFRINGEIFNCSLQEMIDATEGVVLNLFNLAQVDKTIYLPLLQQTYSEYFDKYVKELRSSVEDENYAPDPWANSYHDAVWAMAIALHNASMNGVNLKSYKYNRNNDTMVIARHLLQVEFDGATGHIVFQNKTRSAKSVINIEEIFGGEIVSIGTFDRGRQNGSKLIITSNLTSFINFEFEVVYIRVHAAVGVFAIFLTLLLILLTVLFQLPNTFWHYRSSIKATSPNVSHLVFSGCYLFSIFVILYSILETFGPISSLSYSVFCNTLVWCLLFGYSLIFGTVCAKAWRVYRLFNHFRNQSPGVFLSDNALVLFVTVLLLIDLVVCITWNSIDPLRMHLTEHTVTLDSLVAAYIIQCNCNHWNFWIILLASYKGLIVIPLLIISILNRRIKRKNFQKTRSITILIYSVTLMGGVGIPLYFLLKNQNVYAGYLIISSILQCTVLLCCLTLFLPPMLPILMRTETKSTNKQTLDKRRQYSTSSVNPIYVS